MSSPTPAKGLFDSAKRAVESLLALTQLRLELLCTELEAEKLRVYDGLVQAVMGLVLLALALVGTLGFVLTLFWEGHRLAALGVMVVVFAAAGGWMLLRARQALRGPDGGPFALTLGELRRDRDSLKAAGVSARPSQRGPQPGAALAPSMDPPIGESTSGSRRDPH